jgi:F420-non-reducing hydrogenase small subunit
VYIENFAVCTGCEVAILDIGEALLGLLPQLDFVHAQVLMDNKWFGPKGDKDKLEVAKADVGIITGGIRTEEDKHIALEMRKNVKTLITLGMCAVHGGIPALCNMSSKDEMLKTVYNTHTTDKGVTPGAGIPALLDRVYAVDEVVKPEVQLPGCPPSPEVIAGAVVGLLQGKPFTLSEKSVCDDCPTKREKKAAVALKRPLQSPDVKMGAPLAEMRCLNEQGIICNGPATKTGCGGSDKTPRCIKALMPCRGCFGPIRAGAKPMVDMMGALSSIGLDVKLIDDRMALFNRYIGSHNNLRVLPKKG